MSTDSAPPMPSSPPKRKPRRPCLLAIIISLGIFVGVVGWICLGLRQLIASHIQTDDYATLAQSKTQLVALPDPWHSPATRISPEADIFAQQFVRAMVEIDSKHELLLRQIPHNSHSDIYDVEFDPNVRLSPEEVTSWPLLLQDLQPVIDMTSAAVRLSTYTMEADFSTIARYYFSDHRADFAELTSLAAQEQVRQGNYLAAVELALLPMRMLKRTAQARDDAHEESLGIIKIVLRRFSEISRTCTEPAALEIAAHELEELHSVAFPGITGNWKYCKTLGRLRQAAAEGFSVDPSPQPAIQYYRKAEKLLPDYYEWELATLPPDSAKLQKTRLMLSTYSMDMNRTFLGMKRKAIETPGTWQNRLVTIAIGQDPETTSFLYFIADDRNFEKRILKAQAEYALARGSVKSRRAEIKGLPPPETP